MRFSKVLISFIIFVLTGVGIYITYLLANEEYDVINSSATITERRNAGSVVAGLDDGTKLSNELIVYTNIFTENDKVKIDYAKIKRQYKVLKVYNLEENKNKLAFKIKNDPTVLKYFKKISGNINYENNTSMLNIEALPIQINRQSFELLKEEDYLNFLYNQQNIILSPIPLGATVTLTMLDDFEVVSIQNIDNDMRTELLHSKSNKKISFTGAGKGIYSVKIKYNNGDIINYIFN